MLDDADLQSAVGGGVEHVMQNSGQSCNAPTRMLVPGRRWTRPSPSPRQPAEVTTVGDPNGNAQIGPVVNETQWDKIQRLIKAGIDEGATLVTGGTGRPEGLDKGFYVKPTVFANVTNDMTIAKEEIFGPVLSILGYDTRRRGGEDRQRHRIWPGRLCQRAPTWPRCARSPPGCAPARCRSTAASADMTAPFGGYKMSGNGREWGDFGFDEFLEVKAVLGYAPKEAAE